MEADKKPEDRTLLRRLPTRREVLAHRKGGHGGVGGGEGLCEKEASPPAATGAPARRLPPRRRTTPATTEVTIEDAPEEEEGGDERSSVRAFLRSDRPSDPLDAVFDSLGEDRGKKPAVISEEEREGISETVDVTMEDAPGVETPTEEEEGGARESQAEGRRRYSCLEKDTVSEQLEDLLKPFREARDAGEITREEFAANEKFFGEALSFVAREYDRLTGLYEERRAQMLAQVEVALSVRHEKVAERKLRAFVGRAFDGGAAGLLREHRRVRQESDRALECDVRRMKRLSGEVEARFGDLLDYHRAWMTFPALGTLEDGTPVTRDAFQRVQEQRVASYLEALHEWYRFAFYSMAGPEEDAENAARFMEEYIRDYCENADAYMDVGRAMVDEMRGLGDPALEPEVEALLKDPMRKGRYFETPVLRGSAAAADPFAAFLAPKTKGRVRPVPSRRDPSSSSSFSPSDLDGAVPMATGAPVNTRSQAAAQASGPPAIDDDGIRLLATARAMISAGRPGEIRGWLDGVAPGRVVSLFSALKRAAMETGNWEEFANFFAYLYRRPYSPTADATEKRAGAFVWMREYLNGRGAKYAPGLLEMTSNGSAPTPPPAALPRATSTSSSSSSSVGTGTRRVYRGGKKVAGSAEQTGAEKTPVESTVASRPDPKPEDLFDYELVLERAIEDVARRELVASDDLRDFKELMRASKYDELELSPKVKKPVPDERILSRIAAHPLQSGALILLMSALAMGFVWFLWTTPLFASSVLVGGTATVAKRAANKDTSGLDIPTVKSASELVTNAKLATVGPNDPPEKILEDVAVAFAKKTEDRRAARVLDEKARETAFLYVKGKQSPKMGGPLFSVRRIDEAVSFATTNKHSETYKIAESMSGELKKIGYTLAVEGDSGATPTTGQNGAWEGDLGKDSQDTGDEESLRPGVAMQVYRSTAAVATKVYTGVGDFFAGLVPGSGSGGDNAPSPATEGAGTEGIAVGDLNTVSVLAYSGDRDDYESTMRYLDEKFPERRMATRDSDPSYLDRLKSHNALQAAVKAILGKLSAANEITPEELQKFQGNLAAAVANRQREQTPWMKAIVDLAIALKTSLPPPAPSGEGVTEQAIQAHAQAVKDHNQAVESGVQLLGSYFKVLVGTAFDTTDPAHHAVMERGGVNYSDVVLKALLESATRIPTSDGSSYRIKLDEAKLAQFLGSSGTNRLLAYQTELGTVIDTMANLGDSDHLLHFLSSAGALRRETAGDMSRAYQRLFSAHYESEGLSTEFFLRTAAYGADALALDAARDAMREARENGAWTWSTEPRAPWGTLSEATGDVASTVAGRALSALKVLGWVGTVFAVGGAAMLYPTLTTLAYVGTLALDPSGENRDRRIRKALDVTPRTDANGNPVETEEQAKERVKSHLAEIIGQFREARNEGAIHPVNHKDLQAFAEAVRPNWLQQRATDRGTYARRILHVLGATTNAYRSSLAVTMAASVAGMGLSLVSGCGTVATLVPPAFNAAFVLGRAVAAQRLVPRVAAFANGHARWALSKLNVNPRPGQYLDDLIETSTNAAAFTAVAWGTGVVENTARWSTQSTFDALGININLLGTVSPLPESELRYVRKVKRDGVETYVSMAPLVQERSATGTPMSTALALITPPPTVRDQLREQANVMATLELVTKHTEQGAKDFFAEIFPGITLDQVVRWKFGLPFLEGNRLTADEFERARRVLERPGTVVPYMTRSELIVRYLGYYGSRI